MNQPSFDFSPARARNTDPVTSHEAAGRMNESEALSKQQRLVLDLVRKTPGLTSKELARRHNLDRPMIARRLGEIPVEKGPKRICAVAGTNAVTWYPTTKAAQSD